LQPNCKLFPTTSCAKPIWCLWCPARNATTAAATATNGLRDTSTYSFSTTSTTESIWTATPTGAAASSILIVLATAEYRVPSTAAAAYGILAAPADWIESIPTKHVRGAVDGHCVIAIRGGWPTESFSAAPAGTKFGYSTISVVVVFQPSAFLIGWSFSFRFLFRDSIFYFTILLKFICKNRS
jgi:hypothetical protein